MQPGSHDDCVEEDSSSQLKKVRCVIRRAGARFLRLKIVSKLLLGFLPLVLLLVLFAALALSSLNILHTYNDSIIHTDLPIIESSEKMISVLLDQEHYAKRYVLLPSKDVLQMFHGCTATFRSLVKGLSTLPDDRDLPLQELREYYQQYLQFLVNSYVADQVTDDLPMDSTHVEAQLKERQDALIGIVSTLKTIAQQDQLAKTSISAAMGQVAFRIAGIVCGVGLLLSLAAAFLVTNNIATTIKKLVVATERIAAGDFDYQPDIHNTDELGDLAQSFGEMSVRLKHLEKSFKDASPLTGLPGGVAIDHVLEKRLAQQGAPVSFCMFDLDNFKAYNDRYGYSRGNKMIKATATIIHNVVEELGEPGDFTGHIGGDDFVVITNHYRYNAICREIVSRFDQGVNGFYDQEAQRQGFIAGKDRQGNVTRFPLAGLSVAVVTNENRKLVSYIQVGEIAAELKKLAKKRMGSAIVVDQRVSV